MRDEHVESGSSHTLTDKRSHRLPSRHAPVHPDKETEQLQGEKPSGQDQTEWENDVRPASDMSNEDAEDQSACDL